MLDREVGHVPRKVRGRAHGQMGPDLDHQEPQEALENVREAVLVRAFLFETEQGMVAAEDRRGQEARECGG